MKMGMHVLRRRRAARLRRTLRKRAGDRPRLSIFRSHRRIYAQVIDDGEGRTLASASSLEKDVATSLSGRCGNIAAAEVVGRLVAERATAAGVSRVVFDRGPYLYHGRVKALAEAARSAGLQF